MSLNLGTYAGLCDALSMPSNALEQDDVADDVAAEQATLTFPADDSTSVTDELSRLQETLKHASKGISDGTETEYKR